MKERREQPNHKTNPPMITSPKSIKKTKKNKKTDRQNPQTNGKIKLYGKESHKEAYRYTLTERGEGKKKYIYL